MSNLYLKENPTLKDIQEYIVQMKIERGFNVVDKSFECLCLAEEVGELIAAVKRTYISNIRDINKPCICKEDVSDEIADVLIFLLNIANMCDINVEEAFRNKEEKNKQRTWIKK